MKKRIWMYTFLERKMRSRPRKNLVYGGRSCDERKTASEREERLKGLRTQKCGGIEAEIRATTCYTAVFASVTLFITGYHLYDSLTSDFLNKSVPGSQ